MDILSRVHCPTPVPALLLALATRVVQSRQELPEDLRGSLLAECITFGELFEGGE